MFEKTGDLKDIIRAFAKEYDLAFIASTQRVVNSPKSHNFSSLVYDRKADTFYSERAMKI